MMSEIFKTQIGVRFRDLDANGHVNHVVVFTYFEEGRKTFFLDLSKASGPFVFPFIMAHISCDYLKSITLDARLSLQMWVSKVGNKSFSLCYKLMDLSDESIIYAKGESVQVCFDYVQDKSIKIPVELKHTLDRYHLVE
jgi:acyl-CoA thioester hydrolase